MKLRCISSQIKIWDLRYFKLKKNTHSPESINCSKLCHQSTLSTQPVLGKDASTASSQEWQRQSWSYRIRPRSASCTIQWSFVPKKFAQAACAASRVMWQIYAVRGAYLSAKRGHIWRVSSASRKKLGGVSKAFQFGASQLVSLIDFPHRFSAWGFGNKIDVLKRFILLSRYTNIAMVVHHYPKNQRINSISCHRPWSVP